MYHLLAVGKMKREFEIILKHSNKEDLILLCGANVMNVVATSIFCSMHGQVNLLIYTTAKGRGNGYKERVIMLEG